MLAAAFIHVNIDRVGEKRIYLRPFVGNFVIFCICVRPRGIFKIEKRSVGRTPWHAAIFIHVNIDRAQKENLFTRCYILFIFALIQASRKNFARDLVDRCAILAAAFIHANRDMV